MSSRPMPLPDEFPRVSLRDWPAMLSLVEEPSLHEAELRAVADTLPHLVWSVRPDGSLRYFNQRWVDYTGVAAAQSLVQGLSSFVHPNDRPQIAGLCASGPGSDLPGDCECRLRRADGAYRWMLGRVAPQHDPSGGDAGWLGSFTDIDDQKRAAEDLDRNQHLSRIAANVAQLGGWTLDLSTRKLSWSDECCLIHEVPLGHEPTLEEGISYFPEEHRETVIRLVDACTRDGTPYEFVLPKVTARGRLIWVRSVGEAVRDADGKIIRLQGAFQDITAQRQQQDQLRLLETAVSRIDDIVVIMEPTALDDAGPRMVFVNDAFERLTGYTREYAIGKTPQILWGVNTDLIELGRMRDSMKAWEPARAEMLAYTRKRQELWLEMDVAPLAGPDGRFTHWVGVARDVTERRKQRELILQLNAELEERVLVRTEQLVAANRELESFVYSVSHDLRSPLNTVHGFTQLLLKVEAGNIGERGRHFLERIGSGIKQMGDLIEGLLMLADLSRNPIKLEAIDLAVIANGIESELRVSAPHREVRFIVQDGLQAQGDTRLIRVVLQNLIGNAWKFTSKCTAARIELGCEVVEGKGRQFFVRDNGVGFDMAFAHKLFGTFERLHAPGDFPGAGIGLATVKRIIERHGGRTWAESRPGEGATFYFTLGSGRAATWPSDARTPGDAHMSRF